MSSKAARIRALSDGKRTARQIADEVGCLSSYVRVVLRQRINGASASDISYRTRNAGSVAAYSRACYERLRADPKRWAKRLQQARTYQYERYHADPDFRARNIARGRRWKWRRRAKARIELAEAGV